MNVLGIETSCDETACAVVADGVRIRSSVVSSSLALHRKYGGIIPEIAFRRQLETITEVCEAAVEEAGVSLREIGKIAVTDRPGLMGSLLVGTSFAKALAAARGLALVNVNHLHGHIFSAFLGRGRPPFPFVSLVVSGGHTSLYRVGSYERVSLLGSTVDDAAGEAFDKVAGILGLGYPGGPVIEERALKGDPRAIRFVCSNTRGQFDFSFSGIKTAVLYYARRHKRLTGAMTADICASFQEAVINVLTEKAVRAARSVQARLLAVGGGVAANGALRRRLNARCAGEGIRVLFPEKKFCMDNAAMIASLGYWLKPGGGLRAKGAGQPKGGMHAC